MTPFDTAIRDAKRGTKGDMKRRKRCTQGVVAVSNDDNNKKADDPSLGCVMTATRSGKHQA
jgi:hypothetical protein